MHLRRLALATAAALVLGLAPLPGILAADDPVPGDREREAVALYDAGDYAAALPILQELDAAGRASGPLLYRLEYCLGRANDRVGQQEVTGRVLEKLQQEFRDAPDLEVAFYLSNALRNRRRSAEAGSVARQATDHVEKGEWPKPESALERFRTAKLYADQDRPDAAAEWYRQALEKLEQEPERYPSYIAWSRRYIADLAFRRSDYPAAEAAYDAMLRVVAGTPADLDRLASIRVRLGRYGDAMSAWKRAERMDPARGDRPRYCWRLAAMAQSLGTLPLNSPDGPAFTALGKEDLEILMKEQAQVAKDARAELDSAAAAGESMDPDRLALLQANVAAAKPVFIAAALEYAVRDLPIRETAFFGGYAPLIFHENRWDLK